MTNNTATHDWLDLASALDKLGGDETLYRELVEMFLDSDADDAIRIREYLADENYAEAYRIVHTLKGLSGTLGLCALYDVSLKMDQAYNSGQYEQFRSLFASMRDELSRAMVGFGDVLQRERLMVD